MLYCSDYLHLSNLDFGSIELRPPLLDLIILIALHGFTLYFSSSIATVSVTETPDIPFFESHIHFPLPLFFQSLRQIPRACVRSCFFKMNC